MIRAHVIVVETIHSQRISNIYMLLVKTGLSKNVNIINCITILRITLKYIGGADHVEGFTQSQPQSASTSRRRSNGTSFPLSTVTEVCSSGTLFDSTWSMI